MLIIGMIRGADGKGRVPDGGGRRAEDGGQNSDGGWRWQRLQTADY